MVNMVIALWSYIYGTFACDTGGTFEVILSIDIEKLNAHIVEIIICQNILRMAIDEIVDDLEEGSL